MQALGGAVVVCDHSAEHHSASGGLLLAAALQNAGLLGEAVLNINVALLEDADAVAGDVHIFGGVHVHLDDDRAVDLALDARGRVFAADAAGLVEHVRRDAALVRADEHLRRANSSITNQVCVRTCRCDYLSEFDTTMV